MNKSDGSCDIESLRSRLRTFNDAETDVLSGSELVEAAGEVAGEVAGPVSVTLKM